MNGEVVETFLRNFDMKVAAKIIQLVASGIYRTPANALKELISNAFDADAKRLDINFQYEDDSEELSSIIIHDLGKGINSGDFIFSMTHIGASLKRLEGDKTESGRPIIGRIGIGLLSVGQATNNFEIISVIDSGEGMRAEIDLSPYFDAILRVESLDELKIGNVKVYSFNGEPNSSYTKIILKDLKEPFKRSLVGDISYETDFDFNEHPSYEGFVNWLDDEEIKRLGSISPYNKFMFEIGLLSPVRYLKDGPIRGTKHPKLLRLKTRLEKYDFRVYVNNIEVFKPILYPHKSDLPLYGDNPYKVYVKEINTKVNDRTIKALCYYYHQNKRILPYELRGLLLRVKNVGIGTYENNFSKIASESPIVLHQLTGELYVDEGLDEALNIDRNSFFETDEAYQKLWLELMSWVNPMQLPHISKKYKIKPSENPINRDIRSRMEKIRTDKRNDKIKKEVKNLENKIKIMFEKEKYSIKKPIKLNIKIDSKFNPRVKINKQKNKTVIEVKLNKKYNINIQNTIILILTTQKLALELTKKDPELFEKTFTSLLKDVKI